MDGYCKCGCGGKTTVAQYSDKTKGWVKGQHKKYLQNHNVRVVRNKDPYVKYCYCCKTTLPRTEFYHRKQTSNNINRKSLIHSWCKSCQKAKGKEWGDKNKDKRKGYVMKSKFGISIEDYNAMLLEQKGKCFICGGDEVGKQKKRLSVDHCHKTGEIRKLLCSRCNLALGLFGDNPEHFMRAYFYLVPNSHSPVHLLPKKEGLCFDSTYLYPIYPWPQPT